MSEYYSFLRHGERRVTMGRFFSFGKSQYCGKK